MKTKYIFALLTIMVMSQIILISADNSYTQNFPIVSAGKVSNAQFAVQTLKYEPFPVNPGDTFDLWIKVQNIGEDNTKNANFKLITDYPFSTDDPIQSFGIIPGTAQAYTLKQASDANLEANQVVMRFRVKVDDNAIDGTSLIKLEASADNLSNSVVYSLPIQISKTKTDFDVKVHDITPQESSFVVTNIGDNTADAVLVDVKNQDGVVILNGYEPSSLGDINTGEFTISHLKIVPQKNTKTLTLDISYTDKSGVRSRTEKTITLTDSNLQNICVQSPDKTYMNWVFGAIGLLIGAFVVILIVLGIQKRKESKKHK